MQIEMMKIKKGFTLAEVLVTLAVIGIVAALTIPALMKSSQKSELKAGLKEAHGILSQAVMQMKADQNGANLHSQYNGQLFAFKPVFIKFFNVIEDGNNRDIVPNESPSSVYDNFSKQSGINAAMLDEGQFIINNGMTIFIQNSSSKSVGVLVSVDVNGYSKGPNAWGHDLFTFELMPNDRLLPAGAEETGTLGYFGVGFANNLATYCNPTGTHEHNGVGCTKRALAEETYWDNLP